METSRYISEKVILKEEQSFIKVILKEEWSFIRVVLKRRVVFHQGSF